MPNITLYVTEDFKDRLEKHSAINWSAQVRAVIEQRLDDLEEMDRLAAHSGLTQADVDELAAKVNRGMGRHALKLLREYRLEQAKLAK